MFTSIQHRNKLKKYVKPSRIQETLELIARTTEEHYLVITADGLRDARDNYLLALAETVPLGIAALDFLYSL